MRAARSVEAREQRTNIQRQPLWPYDLRLRHSDVCLFTRYYGKKVASDSDGLAV
jgi:hypothetical protein